MKDGIIHLRDDSFEKNILQTKGALLVDFWAEWCAPCRRMMPILTEITSEFSGNLTVAKMNIDENPITAQKYGIRSIPTILLFCDGALISTKVGELSKGQLREFLNINLNINL